MFRNMIIHIFFKNKLYNLNFEDLLISNISCLNCYVCNSFISAGCQNPSKSGSYFYQQCPIGLDSYCVQKTTTDKNGNMFYMERVCARDCSSSTNPVYANKLDGLSETTTGISLLIFLIICLNYYYLKTIKDICCSKDACNSSISHKISNRLISLFIVLLSFNFYNF